MREDPLWFCGLYDPKRDDYKTSYGTQVPVTSLKCAVSIKDLIADVEMKFTFENTTNNPVEAIFYFRHHEVAMYYFEVKIDNKTVVGKVHEKTKAANIYDDAIASGHGSYMVEKSDTSDMFKMSLGNLPPQKSCTITIRYVTKLLLINNTYLFSFPIPSTHKSRKDEQDGIDMHISAEMNSWIEQLTSDTHDVEANIEKNKATIDYHSTEISSDSGFTIKMKLLDPFVPSGYVLPANNRSAVNPADVKPTNTSPQYTQSHIFALNLCPKLEMSEDDIDLVDSSDLEILFLLDQSGSMAGSRIEQAKNALQIYMRSLPPGCYFNLFGFGTSYTRWNEQSVVYNQKTLEEASSYISDLSANMGGTNILNPLSYMLSQPLTRVRNIVLITDGEVNNAGEILNMVRANSKDSRIFTLGIGEASRFLLEGIAKYGRGIAEFVNSGERVEAKVLNTLRYVVAPTLRHVKVDWGKLPLIRQAPQEISSIFLGEHAVLYAFVDKKFNVESIQNKPVEVTVSGKIGKKKYETKISFHQLVTQPRLTEISAINRLIRDIEKDPSSTDLSIYLSVGYNLVSTNTSMVAVEERDDNVSDAPMQNEPNPQTPVSQPEPRSPSPARQKDLDDILRQLNETKCLMHESIAMQLQRADQLDSIAYKSDELSSNAVLFKAQARSRSSSWFSGISSTLSNIGSSIASAFSSSSSSSSTSPPSPNNYNNNNNSNMDKSISSMSYAEEKKESNAPRRSNAPKSLPSGSHTRLVDKIIYLQSFDGSWDLEPTLLGLLQVEMTTLESKFDKSLMEKDEFKALLATVLAVVCITTKFADLQSEWQMVVQKASRFIKKACQNTKQDETALRSSVSLLIPST